MAQAAEVLYLCDSRGMSRVESVSVARGGANSNYTLFISEENIRVPPSLNSPECAPPPPFTRPLAHTLLVSRRSPPHLPLSPNQRSLRPYPHTASPKRQHIRIIRTSRLLHYLLPSRFVRVFVIGNDECGSCSKTIVRCRKAK